MPQGVVDLFEIVEVQEERSHLRTGPTGLRQEQLGAIEQEGSVREPCQRVVKGLVAQLILEAPLRGHVLCHDERAVTSVEDQTMR